MTEGADAGSQFTLEGNSTSIGRGDPADAEAIHIRLLDKSVSRQQARIVSEPSGMWLEHVPEAVNATLLNGREIERAKLGVGDVIAIGRVRLDVLAREGTNLSGLTEILVDAARASTLGRFDTTAPTDWAGNSVSEETEIRPMDIHFGHIEVVAGDDATHTEASVGRSGRRSHPIGMAPIRIGRGEEVELRLRDAGVSRLHAEVGLEGGKLFVFQKSATNPTLVRGVPVIDRAELRDGDEIQLADRVRLRVAIASSEQSGATPGGASTVSSSGSPSALSRRMSDKIDLDRSIESFQMTGTFLDVDIVSSRRMKTGGAKPEHIIVSFDRFRAYVAEICAEEDGQVLNSNGDELMCFFASAESGVHAAEKILGRLAAFNRDSNLLETNFRFRLGAHTGASLVDLEAGIAYSEVLDTAGHIQKRAEPDTLVVSEETREAIGSQWSVTSVGELTTEAVGESQMAGRLLYRVDFDSNRTR